MDITLERSDGATIGTLFQHIINDMKNSSPLWEDFIAKATKLHACLRAAIQALAAYLDAFQKIADAATNSRGATKEIGTALTRVCLRHKAVETRMKTFTSAIMDCLIIPLQDRLEDWKKQVATIDKDHAKEYKRCRTELKKRSSDTLRLQKKAKKGQTDNLHILVESSMQDVTLRRCELEEVERKSLRSAMIEERIRYCAFVNLLQPVVREECEVMSELGHLQEAMQLIAAVTKDPTILPQASEELILESKTNMNLYPDSPGGSNSQGCSNSLGSRKSSVCSISSMNSSSSGSPGHQFQRSLSQYSPAIRLKPGESSDSGFCSSPALTSQASTAASQSHAVSTWPPHTQDGVPTADRPHTISSAYEKGHQRPALTVYTFQNPETISETQKSPANVACRPPLPVRCSSLERPLSATNVKTPNANTPRQCPSPIPAHITKVLEKTSMFEKLEQQQINNNLTQPTRIESIYGRKNEEIYKSTGLLSDKDSDQIDKETIEELNNLIGELDLFQKEHENSLLMEQRKENGINQMNNNFSSNNSDTTNSDRNDKISISSSSNFESLNLSINSTNMSDLKFNYSDTDITKYNSTDEINDCVDYPNTGYENPSFLHLNESEIVVLRKNEFPKPDVENYYSRSMSEVVVLRCKDTLKNDTNRMEETANNENLQRLSSFKNDGLKITSRPSSPALSTFMTSRSTTPITFAPQPPLPTTIMKVNNHHQTILNEKNILNSMPSDERINRIKPAITPRPASLSGAARVTRRASVNTIKPPPPVRRSSSVTPSHNLGTNSPNLSQQSLIYTSSESLPPPPAYLLDTTSGNSPSIPGNVAGTVKALNEIRHMPASPSVLRRAQQNQINQQHQSNLQYTCAFSTPKSDTSVSSMYTPQSPNSFNSSNDSFNTSSRTPKSSHQQGIYAQPKQISSNMSSFRTSSPGPQKQNSGFLAQLNARIAPNKSQQQHQQQSPQHYQYSQQQIYGHTTAPLSNNEQIYQRSSNTVDQRQYNNHQQQQPLQQQQPQQQQHIYASTPQQPLQQQPQQYFHHHHQQQQPHPKDGKNQIYVSNIPYQQQQQYYQQQQHSNYNQNIYVSTNPFITHTTAASNYSPSSFGKNDNSNIGQYNTNYQAKTTTTSNNSSNNVLSKSSVGFLENLNARLAEQRLSGKAFAVRNLINSKALPDPRICHESLMDQIKRGATLKRNRTINDRSAPKIH